jgi:hypothetical protein
LYRHNVSVGVKNTRPMLVIDRDSGWRAVRLLRSGHELTLTAILDLDTGGPYETWNVVAEIPGTTKADEIVVIGAHLDAWDRERCVRSGIGKLRTELPRAQRYV